MKLELLKFDINIEEVLSLKKYFKLFYKIHRILNK